MTDQRKEINESAATEAADAQVAVEMEESPDLGALKAEAAKAKENWDRYVRAVADFENYKKRAVRERQDAIKFANEGIITTLLPVLDNFEMALAATVVGQDAAIQSLQSGITMIYQQLKKALADAGLEEVDATNQTFDPNLHEAISQQETAETPEGQVVQQLRKGYKLRDRLLRPASVVVAKKPSR